jgi:hypothetical protein
MLPHWNRMQYRLMLIAMLFAMTNLSMANADSVPLHVESEIPHARLLGAGEYIWFGLKIYDAKLWSDEGGYQRDAIFDAPFALDLRYARALQGSRIAEVSIEEMQRMGFGSPSQQKAWLASMKGIFPDVRDGTHLTGVYMPNRGARFYLNGNIVGEVRDPDFARAFFAIWLGPKTSDRKLRNALLADAGPR